METGEVFDITVPVKLPPSPFLTTKFGYMGFNNSEIKPRGCIRGEKQTKLCQAALKFRFTWTALQTAAISKPKTQIETKWNGLQRVP